MIEDNNKEKIDPEKEELKARHKLLMDEFNLFKKKIAENAQHIQSQNNVIAALEKEKLKALSLYQIKEETIREEIENSYNILELTEQSDFYNKKMKEYQNMYLASKSTESEIKEQLLKVLDENYALEKGMNQFKQENSQLFEGYSLLKKEYEHISIKYKSISDLYSKLTESFNKEAKAAEALKKENFHLFAQVKALTEQNSDSIFTFTSVEDLLVKQIQIIQTVEISSQKIEALTKENNALKRSLNAFNKPKDVKIIEIDEEIPIIENELRFTREQFLERLSIQTNRMTAEIVYLENKIKLLESTEIYLKNSIESLKGHNKSLLQKINNYENINIDQSSLKKSIDQIKFLEEKIKSTENMLALAQERNKQLQESLEILTLSIVDLEKRNSTIHIENNKNTDDLINDISKLNNSYSELQQNHSELEKKYKACLSKDNAKEEAFNIQMEMLRKRNIDLCEKIEDLERQHLLAAMDYETALSELREQVEYEQQKKFVIESQLEEMKLNLIGNLDKVVYSKPKNTIIYFIYLVMNLFYLI